MQKSMLKVSKMLAVVARISLWLSGIGLVLMTALISWQVFGRFVLNDSPSWTEPLAVILMGWFVFLGAAVGIREGYHLSFDILVMIVPPKGKLFLYSLSDMVIIAFASGMVYFGSSLAALAWAATLPSLGFPGGVAYLPIVLGGGLMVIFSIERLARRMAGLPTARFGETEPEAV
ncbi:MAG: TRAP transporter small permease [Rhodobacteraceae bacterium]|nr:TRAP transporter small permease [Paracoccaceae bacterium]